MKLQERDQLDAHVTAIRELFHPHARAQAILNDLDQLRKRDNRGAEGGVLTLFGASRSGKTRILRAYQSAFPDQPAAIHRPDGTFADRKEVVTMRMPTTGRKTFYERLLSVLTNMDAAGIRAMKGREYDLGDAVVDMAGKVGMRLLILEEAHQSIENKTPRVAADLATALKDLTNESMFSMVISGTLAARKLIDLSEELEGRVMFEHELTPLDWDRKADRETFCGVLRMFDEHLRDNVFGRLSGLAEDAVAAPLLVAARGHIGHAATLVETAGLKAVQDMLEGGTQALGIEHLFEALHGSPLLRRYDLDQGHPFPGAVMPHGASDAGIVSTRMRGRTRRAVPDVDVRR